MRIHVERRRPIDKPLSATLRLASKFLEKASMTRWMGAREVLRIDVCEGTVSQRELGDERGSDGDLLAA